MPFQPVITNKKIIAVVEAPTNSYFSSGTGTSQVMWPVYYFAIFEDGTTLPYLATDTGMQVNAIGLNGTEKFAINNNAITTGSTSTGGILSGTTAVIKSWFS